MNQYDEMKGMLNISRQGVLNRLLTEDQGQYYDEKQESNREITPEELETEKQEFANTVSKLVTFGDFKVNHDNVTWSGVFPKEKIEWVYSLDSDAGVYISCEMAQMTDSTLEMIQRLRGYYEKWSEKWSGEIGVAGQEPTGEEQPLPQQ